MVCARVCECLYVFTSTSLRRKDKEIAGRCVCVWKDLCINLAAGYDLSYPPTKPSTHTITHTFTQALVHARHRVAIAALVLSLAVCVCVCVKATLNLVPTTTTSAAAAPSLPGTHWQLTGRPPSKGAALQTDKCTHSHTHTNTHITVLLLFNLYLSRESQTELFPAKPRFEFTPASLPVRPQSGWRCLSRSQTSQKVSTSNLVLISPHHSLTHPPPPSTFPHVPTCKLTRTAVTHLTTRGRKTNELWNMRSQARSLKCIQTRVWLFSADRPRMVSFHAEREEGRGESK